jgi:acetyl-CoA acetyltransferase
MLKGSCVEKISSEMEINRQAQDEYAIQSYTRARQASNQGVFDWEIVEVI